MRLVLFVVGDMGATMKRLWAVLLSVLSATMLTAYLTGVLPWQHPEIRARISVLFEEELKASNLSQSDQQVIAHNPQSPRAKQLQRDLRKVWVRQTADEIFKGIVKMFQREPTFEDNSLKNPHFVATSWGSIDVNGTSASAWVTGHTQVQTKNGVKRPNDVSWYIKLHFDKSKKEWLFESRKGTSYAP